MHSRIRQILRFETFGQISTKCTRFKQIVFENIARDKWSLILDRNVKASVSFLFFQKKSTGQQLMEQVYYHLDLLEKDYFGLQYTDPYNVPHWLDATKPVKKQVKSKFPQKITDVSLFERKNKTLCKKSSRVFLYMFEFWRVVIPNLSFPETFFFSPFPLYSTTSCILYAKDCRLNWKIYFIFYPADQFSHFIFSFLLEMSLKIKRKSSAPKMQSKYLSYVKK